MRFKELLRATEHVPAPAQVKDRRRPGRNNQVTSHLVPLLRDPVTMDVPTPSPDNVNILPLKDDLTPIQGIIFSLVSSVPLWVVIVGIVWAVLR